MTDIDHNAQLQLEAKKTIGASNKVWHQGFFIYFLFYFVIFILIFIIII